MRWSAVFAGTVLAIGLWILLQMLGMGIGLAAVDTDGDGNLKGVGIGTGIWSIIAPLIAIFVGALLAGRLSTSRDRKVGAMHGSVMWALALIVGMWAMMALLSSVAAGVARVGGAAAGAGGAMMTGAASTGANVGDAIEALGIDADDLVAPINERLQRDGKPPVTADQLEAAVKGVAQKAVREGRLDRALLVQELARNTALSRADAEDIANELAGRYDRASERFGGAVGRVGERATDLALETADRTGKVMLAAGLMMLLSLGAALAGGALGVPRTIGRADASPPGRTDAPLSTVPSPGAAGADIDRDPIVP
jgi:hypothetical protein